MAAQSVVVLLLLTIATAASADPGDRVITVINMCNQIVRVGRTGGECLTSDPKFNCIDTGCPEGLTCNPADLNCYWDIPPPEHNRSLDLEPKSTITLRLTAPEQSCYSPQTDTALVVKWSGNIWGATGCDVGKGACETAICFDGNITNNGHCPTYQGPSGPVTWAEFTLLNEGFDTYDISILGGINIPVEMKPNITSNTKSAEEADIKGAAAYYWCGNPGGVMASNHNLSNCTWDFALYNITRFGNESILLPLVAKNSSGNANCSQHADCADKEFCGTLEQLNDVNGGPEPNLFPQKCGRLIGLWNANGICKWAAGVSDLFKFPNTYPFRCMVRTGQMFANGTFASLYGCSGLYATSGYQPNPPNPSTVCGCPTWRDEGINAPPVGMCQAYNTVWGNYSLPWIEWMKRGCPTSYVFPFDDESSTFQCQNKDSTYNDDNTQGYTITFCPGGKDINAITEQQLSSRSWNNVDFRVIIVLVILAVLLAVISC